MTCLDHTSFCIYSWLWAFVQGFVGLTAYLNNKSPKDDGTEYQVVKNAFKNISFSVDLPRVDFIEQLHHHKCVEDNCVMLRGRSMKRGVTSTVNVEHLFTWEMSRKQNIVADVMMRITWLNYMCRVSSYQQKVERRLWWAGRPHDPICSSSLSGRWGVYYGRKASSAGEIQWGVQWPRPKRQVCP